jgi:hypothetical protein
MFTLGMKSWLRAAGVGLLAGGGILCFTGCVGVAYPVGPPGVYYDYDYYPDWDVYYYPAGHIYYWNDAGHWRSGREVPRRYHFNEERQEPREHLRLQTRQPWTEHHEEHNGHGERGGYQRDHDHN